MSKKVMTITGPIAPEELGFTSMHEHVMMVGAYMHDFFCPGEGIPPFFSDKDPISLENIHYIRHNAMLNYDACDLTNEERMLGEVTDFKMTGGRSMLDCTAIGIRHDVPGVKRIAEKTGVNIIESTGFYMALTWPDKYKEMDIDGLYHVMKDEIANGIEGTEGIYPGALKIGMAFFDEKEEMALRAAARLCGETGMMLTLHGAGDPFKAIKIMKEEGAPAEKIVMAHLGFTAFESSIVKLVKNPDSWKPNLDYAYKLLDTGINVSMEFLGNSVGYELGGSIGPQDFASMAVLYHCLEKGYAKQLVLGVDLCTNMSSRRGGGGGYTRLTQFAIRTLRDLLEVPQETIDIMVKENPIRLLSY